MQSKDHSWPNSQPMKQSMIETESKIDKHSSGTFTISIVPSTTNCTCIDPNIVTDDDQTIIDLLNDDVNPQSTDDSSISCDDPTASAWPSHCNQSPTCPY